MPTTVLMRPDYLAVSPVDQAGGPSPAGSRVRGGRLALVDNGKPNAGTFLDIMGDLVRSQAQPATVLRLRKSSAGESITEEQLAEVDGSDLAFTGFGDCGSCTSWTVRDAIEIVRRGVPVVVFVTEPFLPLARAVTSSLGADAGRIVALPHPVNVLTADELRTVAAGALDQVLALTGLGSVAEAAR